MSHLPFDRAMHRKSCRGGAPNGTVPSLRDSPQTLAYPALTCRAQVVPSTAGLLCCSRRTLQRGERRLWELRPLQKRGGGKNLDSLKWMKRKQVCIAGNDVCCQSTDSKREKLIVFGIAAGGYLQMNIDPLRFAGECRQKAPHIPFIDVAAELLPAEDLEKLGQNRKGEQNGSPPAYLVHRHARFRPRRQ